MAQMDFKNRTVDAHSFAMVPRADIPRSSFNRQSAHKTTFDAGLLIPIYVDEVLPGDTFHFNMTCFCRMATPVFPIMDNLTLESFFFFVPNRLVWEHWVNFMGEQFEPTDSIAYTIPQINNAVSGYLPGSIYDYLGLPTVGQMGSGNSLSHSALPLRAYNLICNDWFRDENLQNSAGQVVGDGPDDYAGYELLARGKRHDYFTSCLPWTQKGGVAVSLPLGSTAPVIVDPTNVMTHPRPRFDVTTGSVQDSVNDPLQVLTAGGAAGVSFNNSGSGLTGSLVWTTTPGDIGLITDLSSATAATINQIRQAFQVQKLLERDARGGTRYTEIVRSHFGVVSPDARLQRPEYLGGGRSPVNIGSVPQTSATGLTGGSTPQGSLSAFATIVSKGHGFSYSSTEHGHILGLVCVRADLNYQQGVRRMWSRSTRYDFYFPVFAMLGEQAVLNKEIYCDGSANDNLVFGYQERWAEYRYFPSMITGLFRSTTADSLDAWHLAQHFTSVPTLNNVFIQENVPMSRILAAGDDAVNQQFLADFFFDIKTARPMPMYSVPGLVDHF